jgi:hypothetical protein
MAVVAVKIFERKKQQEMPPSPPTIYSFWSLRTYTSSELGPPTPSPTSECAPLRSQRGGGHTRLWEGGGRVPIRTTGEKAEHSVYSVVLVMFVKMESDYYYWFLVCKATE